MQFTNTFSLRNFVSPRNLAVAKYVLIAIAIFAGIMCCGLVADGAIAKQDESLRVGDYYCTHPDCFERID